MMEYVLEIADDFSEGIYQVSGDWLTQMRLQSFTIDHIDRLLEKRRYIVPDGDVIVNGDVRSRIEVDENVQVAVQAPVPARRRAEDGSVRHALRAERWLCISQLANGVFKLHGSI